MQKLPKLHPGKLRYHFDNYMAWSAFARFALLLVFGALALLLGVGFLKLLAPSSESAQDFLEALWWAWGRVADPGTGMGDTGRGQRVASVLTTLGGLCVFALLISFVSEYVQGKLAQLRQTGAPVAEDDHTLVLGFGARTLKLIEELSIANESRKDACIVILTGQDKDVVIQTILGHFGAPKIRTTRIVVRQGSATAPRDLINVAIASARSVIVLADDGGEDRGDARIVRTMLAMLRALPFQLKAHVVVELESAERADVLRAIDDKAAVLVVARDFLGRLIVQTVRQVGLALVYAELLSYVGDEFYLLPIPPSLVGKTFRDLWSSIAEGSVIGLQPANGPVQIGAPDDTVLAAGDRMLILLADDSTPYTVKARSPRAEGGPVREARAPHPTQRVLVLGFKEDLGTVVAELDRFVGPGSEVVVLCELPETECEARLLAKSGPLKNLQVRALRGDPTSRAAVEAVCAGGFHAEIVVADESVSRAPSDVDARTLMSLLLLRSLEKKGQAISATRVVSEIRDPATKELATIARVGDFVVSDELVSQLVAQVSETPELGAVWGELCSAEGYEIYLKPVSLYAHAGESVDFFDLQARARRHGEVIIGWSLAKDGEDKPGVTLNPPDKDARRTFGEHDRLVVLAADD